MTSEACRFELGVVRKGNALELMRSVGLEILTSEACRFELAGVVRKKMKLKLVSEKIDGTRIYRIDGTDTKANRHPAKRRAV